MPGNAIVETPSLLEPCQHQNHSVRTPASCVRETARSSVEVAESSRYTSWLEISNRYYIQDNKRAYLEKVLALAQVLVQVLVVFLT
jgi:hypothetical protein